jgi:DNA-binding CsgD family transcriptional regulator
MGYWGRGADTFDIAAALGATNHTVESYYSRILIKLDLNGMHELRRHAIVHLQKHIVLFVFSS